MEVKYREFVRHVGRYLREGRVRVVGRKVYIIEIKEVKDEEVRSRGV